MVNGLPLIIYVSILPSFPPLPPVTLYTLSCLSCKMVKCNFDSLLSVVLALLRHSSRTEGVPSPAPSLLACFTEDTNSQGSSQDTSSGTPLSTGGEEGREGREGGEGGEGIPPSDRRYVLHDVDVRLLGNSAFIRKAMKTRCNPKALVSLVHYMSYNNVQFSHDMCFTVRGPRYRESRESTCTPLFTALYTTIIRLLSHGPITWDGSGGGRGSIYQVGIRMGHVKALCPSS